MSGRLVPADCRMAGPGAEYRTGGLPRGGL